MGNTGLDELQAGIKIAGRNINNLFAEYIMRKARLDESQTGIKIAGRNINSLRYADDITLTAEIKEELKSLLMWGKKWVKKLA